DSRGCDCTGFLANGAAESSSAAAFLARAFVVRHWNRRAHIARRGYSGRRAAALAVSRALVFVGFAQWSRSVDFGDARRRASPTCLISPCERGNRLQEKTSASIERRDGRAGYCRGLHWSARRDAQYGGANASGAGLSRCDAARRGCVSRFRVALFVARRDRYEIQSKW